MIKEFIEYQSKVRGLSHRTCEEYEKSLQAFIIWARPQGLRWSTITKQDIDRFTQAMSEKKLSSSTIKSRISALRCIYAWMMHEGMIEKSPAKWCQTPKRTISLPQPADVEKIDAYLSTPATSRADAQMHMLTAILLETGLRISEALQLVPASFDLKTQSIRVEGKGRKQRIVFFGERTTQALQRYSWSGTKALFEGMTDVSARFLMYDTLGRYCPGIHPHQLRHTFGCQQLNRGMSMASLATLMGHSNIHTTEIYARATANTAGAEYKQINS